jgi:tRNA A37 methylthiotransferase MiaB
MKSILILRPYWGINVNGDMHGELGISDAKPEVFPDLSLLSAASLASLHFNTSLIDANSMKLSPSEWLTENYSIFDCIIVKACAPTVGLDIESAHYLKRKYPSKGIVVVGHAVFMFIDVLKELFPDIKFGKSIEEEIGRMCGLDSIKLNDIPSLNFNLFNPQSFIHSTGEQLGTVMSSRGCIMSCGYCPYTKFFPDGLELRDPEKVINDIKSWIDVGATRIVFRDQLWGANKNHREKLLELITKENFDIPWVYETRPEFLNENLISQTYKAGAQIVNFGIESIDKNKMSEFKRNSCTIEEYQKICSISKQYGLQTFGFLIVGFPGDDREKVAADFQKVLSIGLDWIKVSVYSAYPYSDGWDFEKGNNRNIKIFNQFDNTVCIDDDSMLTCQTFTNLVDCLQVLFGYNHFGAEHALSIDHYQRSFRSRVNYLNDLYKKCDNIDQITFKDTLFPVGFMKK